MNIDQIKKALTNVFQNKRKRIVFWYDGEKEFEDVIQSIRLDEVKIIRLDEVSSFELKIKLECEDLENKYILYAPFHIPDSENDWLMDIRLYSYTFQANKASIVLNELNLDNQSILPFLKERNDFFQNKDRFDKLKKWVNPDDSEDNIDLKMLAVITCADQPDLFSVLMKLFESMCNGNDFDKTEPSKYWAEIEKPGLNLSFWKFVEKDFGYTNEKKSLSDFIIRIMVTDFSNQLKHGHKEPSPMASFNHFLLNDSKAMNSSVFLSQWRNNIKHCKNYNLISGVIAKDLNIHESLYKFGLENLLESMTFEVVEKWIISSFRDQIISGISDYREIKKTIEIRLDGYWTLFNGDSTGNLYKTVYNALETTIQFFSLIDRYSDGFSYPTPEKMFDAYTKELFRFDQFYRKFIGFADEVEFGGWDILKSLREKVEDIYSERFLNEIALKWVAFLDSDASLLDKWKIPLICNQYEFFDKHIRPILGGSLKNRIFVIISDGFRYEIAEELMQSINGKYRLKAELEPMLGVLPSFTSLAMAALLPHNSLSFKQNSADILIDGKPTGTLNFRSEILSNHNGTAINADELTSMKKEQGREFIKSYRLIYIYHNQIDATGDNAKTETRIFEAAHKTITELSTLVNFIINNLNGTKVIITADHGFMYNSKTPTSIDKSALDKSHKNALKTHKRFVLGHNLNKAGNTHYGNTKVTIETKTDMEFLLAKGTNLFNFVSGSRYYHGGAMLQEIVIPVITVFQMKGKHLEESEIKQVGISLAGTYKKIVTNIPRFEFIQTDAVSNRFKARTIKVSIRDGIDLISDEKTITFDNTSSSIDERKKSISLILKTGQQLDNKKEYHLVLRNSDETEYDRIPIMIDIAFAGDF